MVVLVQANVLTVGLDNKNDVLRQLPIRLAAKPSAGEAVRWLRNEKVDSVVSKWDLVDMKDGLFLRKLRVAKPYIPTIVFVKPGDRAQEIEARCLGATTVLPEDTDDELLKQTLINILSLTDLSAKEVSTVKKGKAPGGK